MGEAGGAEEACRVSEEARADLPPHCPSRAGRLGLRGAPRLPGAWSVAGWPCAWGGGLAGPLSAGVGAATAGRVQGARPSGPGPRAVASAAGEEGGGAPGVGLVAARSRRSLEQGAPPPRPVPVGGPTPGGRCGPAGRSAEAAASAWCGELGAGRPASTRPSGEAPCR